MKIPITLSLILSTTCGFAIYYLLQQGFTPVEKATISVYILTALGGLISAIFLIYGYYVSLSVFKESLRPKIRLQVINGRTTLITTNENVHMTHILYSNPSNNDCSGLVLTAHLICGNEEIAIPNLFKSKMDIGSGDQRDRNFPTFAYLSENGVDGCTQRTMKNYKLRVGYSYKFMGDIVTNHYDYTWAPNVEHWNID